MKTTNPSRFSFATKFNTVNAGQRKVEKVDPEFIVCSTEGGFRITGPVSKALGIEAGDNIMFINNVDDVDRMILEQAPEVVAFCEDAGLDITSPEAAMAVHKAADQWAIAKGIQEFDAKGLPKTCMERLTMRDRVKYVKANFAEMLEAANNSGNEELVVALNVDGITEEKQIELLAPFVQSKELNKYTGSKTANPANLTGTGVILTFTDSNVWSQLKEDLGEKANTVNRVYKLDLSNLTTIEMSNGYENVSVKAIILGDYTDVTPLRIGSKKNDEAEA